MLAVSACEWEGLRGRPQHFMRLAAASGWRVLYLEPPASLLAPIREPGMLARWTRWRAGLRSAGDGLRVLAAPPTLPLGGKSRRVNRINQALIAATVSSALRSLGVAEVDVYAFLPAAVDLLPRLRYRRLIYDCVDDHAAFAGLVDPRAIESMERDLMTAADLCFASSPQLVARKRSWGPALHLIPNGCEPDAFAAAARPGALPTPPELRPLVRSGSVLAGFFGGLGTWIDVPLLAELARRRPRAELILLGPARTDLRALEALPNVHLLGPRPYEQLPCFLQHFTACLIPFRRQRLTDSVNPIKLYEYLAAGKAVISTPVPDVLAFGDAVAVAPDAAGFARALDRAAAAGGVPEKVEERQVIARASSWTGRWRQALALIEAVDSPGRRP